jgi:hypothetical protein
MVRSDRRYTSAAAIRSARARPRCLLDLLPGCPPKLVGKGVEAFSVLLDEAVIDIACAALRAVVLIGGQHMLAKAHQRRDIAAGLDLMILA